MADDPGNVGDIEEQFKIDQDTKGVDLNYFRDLLFGVAVHQRAGQGVRLSSPVRWKKWTWWTRHPASGDLRADPS